MSWWLLLPTAVAQSGYQNPPDAIATILDASRPPLVRFSPDRTQFVELDRPSLPPLAELAEPSLELAGGKINPRTWGPARTYAYTGMTLRAIGSRARRTVDVGDNARIRNLLWHPDGTHVAYTQTRDNGLELWVVDVATGTPTKLTEPVLNAVYGNPCDWLPGDAGLVCKVVPEDLGDAPVASGVPDGPRIEENLGGKRPARTYQNLLQTDHDEALFAHYFTSALVQIGLDGTTKPLLEGGLVDEAWPSPDGEWLLVKTLHAPFSRQVPASRFPSTWQVMSMDDHRHVTLADLPLADDVPTTFGSVRTGKRNMGWRTDQAATLWWVEALDGGDAGAEVALRDQVSLLSAPFDGDPTVLWQSELRFGGLEWGDDTLALAVDYWWSDRRVRTWQLDPSNPEAEPVLHWDRSMQDRYGDPGDPMTEPGPFGAPVLRLTEDRSLLLDGAGYSPEGIYPFLDRYHVADQTTERLWQARDPYLEWVIAMTADNQLITRRESAKAPPNYAVRRLGRKRAKPLTTFTDWAPPFAKIRKELVRYTREDGVELTATLYLPPGYRPRRDGPIPTVFWAYPNEFKSASDAGQVTDSENRFTRPGGSSHLFFLLAGYAVVDDPSMPIIGEGDAEPNDAFREQLVSSAKAAVDTLVAKGITDPERTVIGGHSYGAFMVANLLAHSDLFRAGIARSGAYNRSLTPFGFQGEQRTYWEARDTYVEMSPFTYAHTIDEPILLLHGADDSNSGTYPVQSERLYEAIKGNGGIVRWVELPHEDHGYRARESVGHVLWEMLRWADTYAANAEDRAVTAASEDAAPAE